MTIGARGLTAILLLALWLGGCTQQQWRSTRDNTLGLFGFTRKPATVRVVEPTPAAAPAAPAAVPEEEPVPVAAPRPPVDTERVAPPTAVRPRQRS